jgi:hypothetical protein
MTDARMVLTVKIEPLRLSAIADGQQRIGRGRDG